MKDIVYAFALLAIDAICFAVGNLQTTQYANIDESVVLNCNQTDPTEVLQWRRNDVILTEGDTINPNSTWQKRITIYYMKDVGLYNLGIANVTAGDFGDYMCVMQRGEDISKLLVRLRNKDFQTSSTDPKVSGEFQDIVTESFQTTLSNNETSGHYGGILTVVFCAVSILSFGSIISMAIVKRRRVTPNTTATHKK